MIMARAPYLGSPPGFLQDNFLKVRKTLSLVKQKLHSEMKFLFVGVGGIEPPLLPPQGSGLPLSDTPQSYFCFPIVFIHFVQARILFPRNFFRDDFLISRGTRTHCKLGYLLYFLVGLNLPRSLINLQAVTDFFPQTMHCFSIVIIYYNFFEIFAR